MVLGHPSLCRLSRILQEFHTSSSFLKNTRVGVFRRTRNRSLPLTYEQTKKPHQIGVMKSWNSWNTANLEGETRYTSEITLSDDLIRMFIKGTFPTAVLSEVVIKRQHNLVRVAFLLCNSIKPMETHFLIGYSEEMLSHLLRCIVKLEVQTVSSKRDTIFRYI